MAKEYHFRIIRYISFLVCLLLLVPGLETALGAGAGKLFEKPGPEPQRTIKQRPLSPKEAARQREKLEAIGILLNPWEKKEDEAQRTRNKFIRGVRKQEPRLPPSGPHSSEINPKILFDQAQKDYQENKWTKCHEKLSILLDSPQTDQGTREMAIRLYQANLEALTSFAYQEARLSRDWSLARRSYQICRDSRYTDALQKLEAEDTLRQIDNQQAVDLMPANSLILEVLPSGYFHLAMKSLELSYEKETFKTMFEMEGLQEQLQHEKRILIGPEARKRGLADYDFTQVFPDKVVWRDPNLEQAAKDIKGLCNETLSLKDFSTAVLLPRDVRQQELLGLNWTDKDRDRAWEGAEGFIKESGISDVVTSPWNRRGLLGWVSKKKTLKPLKEELVNTLQTKKGVLIFFSHGDRDGISLLDGNRLTAVEVSKLDLSKNKPVVLIFSCEAAKREEKVGKSVVSYSIVEALKKAGAKAVFGFQEKVDAGESTSDALKFTKAFKSSKTVQEKKTTVGEALEKMILEIQGKKGPRTMLKVKIETETARQKSYWV